MFANNSGLLFGGFLAVIVDVAALFPFQARTDVNKPANEFPSFEKENLSLSLSISLSHSLSLSLSESRYLDK